MTILPSDLKFFASARMTDEADSGGEMTTVVVQDGEDNNVYPDLDSIVRARGAMQFRKLYGAIDTANTDAGLGGHVIIDRLAEAAEVSAVVLKGESITETLSDLVTRINADALGVGWKGATVLTADASVGAVDLVVERTRAVVIPGTASESLVSGVLVGDSSVSLLVAAGVLADAAFHFTTSGLSLLGADLDGVTPASGGYDAVLRLLPNLPLQISKTTITSGNRAYVYYLSVPVGTAPGSESVRVNVNGVWYTLRCNPHGTGTEFVVAGSSTTGDDYLGYTGVVGFPNRYYGDIVVFAGASGGGTAWIDRAAGVITLALGGYPMVGTDIIVGYALGSTLHLDAGGADGLTASSFTPPVPVGRRINVAIFRDATQWYSVKNAIVYSSGTARGTYNPSTGLISIPTATGNVAQWYAIQEDDSTGVVSASATLPAGLSPETVTVSGQTVAAVAFSETASSAGQFSGAIVSGAYNDITGKLALTFSTPVKSDLLTWSATQLDFLPSVNVLPGLDTSKFPASGEVPIFERGDVVVLQHIDDTAPETVANGANINVGRTDIAWAILIGADDKQILSGYTVNLGTGLITVVNASGWQQPVHARHARSHTAALASTPGVNALKLNRPLAQAFPAGSIISSAVVFGAMQARVSDAFSQESWNDVWQDTRIGDPIIGQYQDVLYPIEVNNRSAVTERWAVIFTTSTAFRVVGEHLGQVTTGSVNVDCSPLNTLLGLPYFTLRALGWGGGHSAGEVLRFNTYSATGVFWGGRITKPSAPSPDPDLVTYALLIDVNA